MKLVSREPKRPAAGAPSLPFGYVAAVLVFVVLLCAGFLYYMDWRDKATIYSSNYEMCLEFAQSYLTTTTRLNPNMTREEQSMMVDVETELFDLCRTELTKSALGDYDPSALLKYRDASSQN